MNHTAASISKFIIHIQQPYSWNNTMKMEIMENDESNTLIIDRHIYTNSNNNFLTNNENTRNENEWGDLECLFKACQAAITNGDFFTDTGVYERGEDEW